MDFSWLPSGEFVSGIVLGGAVAAASQIAATKFTQERHTLEVNIVSWNPQYKIFDADPEASRGLVLRNTGHFVERDIEVRLEYMQVQPNFSFSIQNTRLPLSEIEATFPKQDFDSDYRKSFTWHIEFLSPKEEIRFDFTSGHLIYVYFLASSDQALARKEWEHPEADKLRSAVHTDLYGPPMPPFKPEVDIDNT